MIVVSDTSAINYLVLIELQDRLPKRFDRILIPEAVHRELQSAAAPQIDPALRQLDTVPRHEVTVGTTRATSSVTRPENRPCPVPRLREDEAAHAVHRDCCSEDPGRAFGRRTLALR